MKTYVAQTGHKATGDLDLVNIACDLGHALQLANRKGDAARVFEAAVALWQGLLKSRPENEEYQEGLSWSRQRLEDLK